MVLGVEPGRDTLEVGEGETRKHRRHPSGLNALAGQLPQMPAGWATQIAGMIPVQADQDDDRAGWRTSDLPRRTAAEQDEQKW